MMLTSKADLVDGIRKIDVEWWTENFCSKVKSTTKFYSKPFPGDTSGPQFRLMYKFTGYNNREVMIYYSVWNSDFNSTTMVLPSEVTVFRSTWGNLIKQDTSTMRLPDNVAKESLVTMPKSANIWELIGSSKVDLDFSAINVFYIYLSFDHPEIKTPNDNIIQTITVCEFSDLLDDTAYSDITIVANDGTRRTAHKLVLVARSKVFYAMFKHDMIENQEKEVKLDDISPEMLDIFLNFLYMGILPPNLEYKECKCILNLGDKYGISALKILAQEHLYKLLSIENAVEVLIMANLHGAELLKELTLISIKEVGIKIIKTTKGWKKLAKHADVGIYILENL